MAGREIASNIGGKFDMKLAVRHYSRGGNTKKIAEAIAKAVGVKVLGKLGETKKG